MTESWHPNEAPRSEIALADYLAEHGSLPVSDRSHVARNRFVSQGQADLGRWASVITSGDIERPLLVETWADEGHLTCQTCFFSRIGLEDETAVSVLVKFRDAGIIACRDDTSCNLLRILDASGHPLWSFTLTIGAGDTIYVSKPFPCEHYPDEAFAPSSP